jgi:hypothetical protein
MQSIHKSAATMRDLKAALDLRFSNGAGINSSRLAADAQSWPMLFLSVAGNEAAGQPCIAIRIKGLVRPNPDIFQQTQWAYAPHTLEIAFEKDVNSKPSPALADLLSVMFECTKTGITILDKEIANGTAVSEASMNAAVVAVELNDLYWPNKGV